MPVLPIYLKNLAYASPNLWTPPPPPPPRPIFTPLLILQNVITIMINCNSRFCCTILFKHVCVCVRVSVCVCLLLLLLPSFLGRSPDNIKRRIYQKPGTGVMSVASTTRARQETSTFHNVCVQPFYLLE